MYKKHLEILAQACKDTLRVMANTEMDEVIIEETDNVHHDFAVAQATDYQHLDDELQGQFVLGFSDEAMATRVASVLAKGMGLETLDDTFGETAREVLNEFVNTVVGHTISEWDKIGLPVRFSPPSCLARPAENLELPPQTKIYQITICRDDFCVRFQVSFTEMNRGHQPIQPDNCWWLTRPGARVLVVDDSPLIRKIISQTLKEVGFEIAEAANGVIAVEKHYAFKPILTITDMVMPEMGGLQAIKAIRKMNPQAKFIVMTSTARQDEVIAAKNLGVLAYIIKPVDRDRLLESVNRALKAA